MDIGAEFAGGVVQHILERVALDRPQLAMRAAIALPQRRKRSGFSPQLHQIVHELRRYPEVPRSLPVPVAFVDIRDNPRSKLYRMWLAYQ